MRLPAFLSLGWVERGGSCSFLILRVDGGNTEKAMDSGREWNILRNKAPGGRGFRSGCVFFFTELKDLAGSTELV
jgi:hypothetical protein